MNTSGKNFWRKPAGDFPKIILSRTRQKENANIWWVKENVFLGQKYGKINMP
jgi:hypothetical protein